MRKIFLAILLFPCVAHAGTITTYFGNQGQVIMSSQTPPSPSQDFTAADGTLLTTYNSLWINMPHATGGVSQCQIMSNEVRASAAYSECYAMWSGSASNDVQMVIKPFSDDANVKQVCVRAGVGAGTNKSGYCAGFIATIVGGNWIRLGLLKDGTYLDEWAVVADTSTDHTIRITASGTSTVSIDAYLDSSPTTLGTLTDSSSPLSTVGNPGFVTVGNGDATVTGMDDWQDNE